MTSLENLSGYVWWNGQFINCSEAKIHMSAHSLHYAGAVFEGMRIYNKKPFKQLEHYQRLIKSAEAIGYTIQYTPQFLCTVTNKLIDMNGLNSGYIRPFAWRGGEEHNIKGVSCKIHTAIIAHDPFSKTSVKTDGLKLIISEWRKPPANSFPFYSKTSGLYTMATVIQNEAVKDGFDDAIMLDQDGYLTEATTSNFFFIKNNILYTPTPDCFLDGLTRQTIITEIAPKLGIQTVEGKFTINDLVDAQAAFIAGTASEITPISVLYNKYNDKSFNFSAHDTLLQNIQNAYQKIVEA